MKRTASLLVLVLLSAALAACASGASGDLDLDATATEFTANMQATETALALKALAPTSTPEPTSTPTATQTPTPPPTSTPVPTSTPTPVPGATVLASKLSLRSGPKKSYNLVATVRQGEELLVVGKSRDCAWLEVETSAGKAGWVKVGEDNLETNFSCDQIPGGIYRPKNGTIILDEREKRGLNLLVVKNGTEYDSVVVLDGGVSEPKVAFYVRSGNRYTLRGIKGGMYRIYFATGADWNADLMAFTTDVSYKKLDKLFFFVPSNVVYTIQTIQLKPAAGGNVKVVGISASGFPDF